MRKHSKCNCELKGVLIITVFLMLSISMLAQADIEWMNKQLIRIIDPLDNTPLVGAHICVELANGQRFYEVSDAEGKAFLNSSVIGAGNLVVSSIGYVTRFLTISEIGADGVIHLKADVLNLDQVVVTGSSRPAPVDSSIYKVKLISEDKIKRSGAVNLSELLLTEANIRMTTDLVLGSQIEMLGMNGQNVKVMIDGVPVIGRLDGNVDLSQINLANVKQVEVIEGPMSVIYGNNALAGTINIITKKEFYHELSGQVNAYMESAGRYAGNAGIAKKFKAHTISVEGGYDFFTGVDFDESDRQMDWKPKKLYRFNGGYGLNLDSWQLNAKYSLYQDELHNKSNLSGTKVYDTFYYTRRNDFSLSVVKSWNKGSSLNIVAAFNDYDRASQDLTKDLSTLHEKWGDLVTTQQATQHMTRAIFTQVLVPDRLTVQSGLDILQESMKGPRIVDGEQSIGDYAGFLNVNYLLIPNLEIQPGFRYACNTDYNAPLVYSLNAKWIPLMDLNWRFSVAKGFRAPSVKELYYEFVDSNHEIFGNSNLKAESSYNFNTSLDYTIQGQLHRWRFGLATYYNNVNNLIALIQKENSTQYSYANIEEYESTGGNVELNYAFRNTLSLRGGYGVTGRLNSYTKVNGKDKFNISHDVFAGIKWFDSKSKLTISADYKYNGAIPYFYADVETGMVKEGTQEAFNTLNASLSISLLKNRLGMTAGGKNIFDVTTVSRMAGGGGAHSGGSGVPVSYGRSYFINLIYKFNYSNNN